MFRSVEDITFGILESGMYDGKPEVGANVVSIGEHVCGVSLGAVVLCREKGSTAGDGFEVVFEEVKGELLNVVHGLNLQKPWVFEREGGVRFEGHGKSIDLSPMGGKVCA